MRQTVLRKQPQINLFQMRVAIFSTLPTIPTSYNGKYYRCLPGVANRGVRPTFGPSEPVLEVHLPGFQGDLNGRELAVEVVARIRGEKKFPSPQALAARIAQDVEEARRILQERE